MFRKIILLLAILGCLGFLAPNKCAAAGNDKIRYTSAMGRKYVYLRDVAKYYNMRYYNWNDRVVLYNDNFKLTIFPEKKYALVNGIRLGLLFSPYSSGPNSFLSDKDFLLTIDPLVRDGALPQHRLRLIMIDPGHGGKDNGGKFRYREKDIVLRVAGMLSNVLRKKGFTVAMTRTSDQFIELPQRSKLCRDLGADLFISIHCNSAANPEVNGIETFCLAPYGTSSTNSTSGFVAERRENGNRYDPNNMALAYDIHKSLIARTKAFDRGIKRARFMVLKNAPCPAVLIECGFLSNKAEEMRLGSDWYQNLIAQAITDGVANYGKDVSKR
ncbi:MAG: N-acetylmuramoyl-L-alanine amidase family protein [Victivallaceae bacterium]